MRRRASLYSAHPRNVVRYNGKQTKHKVHARKKFRLMDIRKQAIKDAVCSSLQRYATMAGASANLTPKAILQAKPVGKVNSQFKSSDDAGELLLHPSKKKNPFIDKI